MSLNVEEFKPRLKTFRDWLNARGAEILMIAGDYELLRFRTAKGVSIVTRRKSGEIALHGESKEAWNSFLTNGVWRANRPVKRRQGRIDIGTIRQRDGDDCFYCLEYVSEEAATEEHLVPITHGGPDHISNKFLAHKDCNQKVGHLSAPEKIQIHTNAALNKAVYKLREIYGNNKKTGN